MKNGLYINKPVLFICCAWASSIERWARGISAKSQRGVSHFGLSINASHLIYFCSLLTFPHTNKFCLAPSYSSAWLFCLSFTERKGPQSMESKFKRCFHTNTTIFIHIQTSSQCVRAMTARSICGLVLICSLNSPCERVLFLKTHCDEYDGVCVYVTEC